MEYALSTSIKKISIIDKKTIGFLQGHGEPSLNAMSQVLNSLSILYDVVPVTLNDTMPVLNQYPTVAIIAPQDTIPPEHLMQLDNYLANGGNLFIACNRVQGDFRTAMGNSVETGLENWLNDKGLIVENNFIIDANCASVSVTQQHQNFQFTSQIQFPYIPIITTFGDHPITEGLEAVILQFASSITYTGDTTSTFTPLAKSSDHSGTEVSPTYFNINREWTQSDFPLSNLTVAGLLHGKIKGDKESKIILVSDGDFPVNGEGGQMQQIQPDNVSLMVNSIDWLSDDTGLIELRTKGVTARPIDQLEDSTKTILKYLNFLLPIILIVIYGIIRMQRNRNLRVKRMEDNYV
jgi:gliding-associated putative ABC transporter substrate-binding component GldG